MRGIVGHEYDKNVWKDNIMEMVQSKVLSDIDDRWIWDLNGEGVFRVKDARDLRTKLFFLKLISHEMDQELVPIKFCKYFVETSFAFVTFAVMWPFRFLASFVVGGTCIGLLVVLIRSGWSGLNLSGWAPSVKGSWKAFFTCLCGVCGTFDFVLEVNLRLVGIVGYNIRI
ncbi:hypothetical protein Tco_0352851 [Tanacetum coccineum]